jgi:hypothetical protein
MIVIVAEKMAPVLDKIAENQGTQYFGLICI